VNGLPIGLGVRVPTLVVSPFSRGGSSARDVRPHVDLRFLENMGRGSRSPISRVAPLGLWRSDSHARSHVVTVSWPSLPATRDPGPGPSVTVKPRRLRKCRFRESGSRPLGRFVSAECQSARRRCKRQSVDRYVQHRRFHGAFGSLRNRYRTDGPWSTTLRRRPFRTRSMRARSAAGNTIYRSTAPIASCAASPRFDSAVMLERLSPSRRS